MADNYGSPMGGFLQGFGASYFPGLRANDEADLKKRQLDILDAYRKSQEGELASKSSLEAAKAKREQEEHDLNMQQANQFLKKWSTGGTPPTTDYPQTPPVATPAVPGGQSSITPEIKSSIIKHASAFGIEPKLLAAVILQESGGNPSAIGDGGKSIGLGQLQKGAIADVGGGDPTNPDDNIRMTAAYLAKMRDANGGDMRAALTAYNGGIGNVQRGTVSAAAQAYPDKVMGRVQPAMFDQGQPPQIAQVGSQPLSQSPLMAGPGVPTQPGVRFDGSNMTSPGELQMLTEGAQLPGKMGAQYKARLTALSEANKIVNDGVDPDMRNYLKMNGGAYPTQDQFAAYKQSLTRDPGSVEFAKKTADRIGTIIDTGTKAADAHTEIQTLKFVNPSVGAFTPEVGKVSNMLSSLGIDPTQVPGLRDLAGTDVAKQQVAMKTVNNLILAKVQAQPGMHQRLTNQALQFVQGTVANTTNQAAAYNFLLDTMDSQNMLAIDKKNLALQMQDSSPNGKGVETALAKFDGIPIIKTDTSGNPIHYGAFREEHPEYSPEQALKVWGLFKNPKPIKGVDGSSATQGSGPSWAVQPTLTPQKNDSFDWSKAYR